MSCRDGEEHIEELFRMYFQTFLKFEYKEEETVKDILGVSILENLVDVVLQDVAYREDIVHVGGFYFSPLLLRNFDYSI